MSFSHRLAYLGPSGESPVRSRLATVGPFLPCRGLDDLSEVLARETPAAVVVDLSSGGPDPSWLEAARLHGTVAPWFVIGGPDTAAEAGLWLKCGVTEYVPVGSEVDWVVTLRGLLESLEALPPSDPVPVSAVPHRYQLLVQQLSGSPFETTADGLWARLSAGWSGITGADPRDLLGTPVVAALHADDRATVSDALAAVGREGFDYARNLVRALTGDGGWRWVELNFTGRGDGGAIGLFRDVTEERLAEEAFRRSELHYRALLEQLPAVVYRSLPGQGLGSAYVSPQIRHLLGFSPAEWRHRPDLWRECLHPADRERVLAAVRGVEANGDSLRIEYRLCTREGEARWVVDESRRVGDVGCPLALRQGVLLDITAQREAEERVSRQEAILLAVRSATDLFLRAENWEEAILHGLEILARELGASSAAIFERQSRRDGRSVVRVHHVWPLPPPGTGRGLGGLEGRSLHDVGLGRLDQRLQRGQPFFGRASELPPAEAQALRSVGVSAIAAMPILVRGWSWGSLAFEVDAGSRGWTAAELQALRVGAEQFGAALQRMQLEQALRASEHRLELGLKGGDLGVWEFEVRRQRMRADERLAVFLGLPADEREIGCRDILDRLHPDDRGEVRKRFDAHLAGRIAYFEAECRVRSGGGWRWVTARGKVCDRSPEGSPRLVSGTWLDITDRRQGEEERARFDKQLQQTQKLESLGVLAGGIAHDFNNLLTVVRGFADLVLYQLPPESGLRQPIEKIEQTVERMSVLTGQMLAYSGRGTRVVGPVRLNTFVESTGDLLRIAAGKRARVDLQLAPVEPRLEADEVQIRQVLLNLVTNAAEALSGGIGTITIRTGECVLRDVDFAEIPWKEDLRAGKFVWLEVADTGSGIAADDVPRLFEPFFTRKFGGRGLGLAAVRSIVREYRGLVRVQSREGQGSSFRIFLPAIGSTGGTLLASADAPAATAAPPAASQPAVLVVDDEAPLQQVVAHFLSLLGYKPLAALDGESALAQFRAERASIAAVLLDVTLPRQDGGEVLAALRAVDPEVRVVLMSGYQEAEARQRCGGAVAAGFLPKPFKLKSLAECLKSVAQPAPALVP